MDPRRIQKQELSCSEKMMFFSEEIPLPYKLYSEYDDATFNENYVILIDELYSGTTRSGILEKHRSIANKQLK